MTTKQISPLAQLTAAVLNRQSAIEHAAEQAGIILENELTEIAQTVDASASRVAQLESNLEVFDGLENERLARETRAAIASAMDEYRLVVDAAKRRTQAAALRYLRAVGAAAVAGEAALNAAAADAGCAS